MANVFVVHDLRFWGGSDAPTKDPLSNSWRNGLRRSGVPPMFRSWCLAWRLEDPVQCVGVLARADPRGRRGRTRVLGIEDLLLEHPIAVPARAWVRFLGLIPPWTPKRASRIDHGHPEAQGSPFRPFEEPSLSDLELREVTRDIPAGGPELAKRIIKRYVELAKLPDIMNWHKKLPVVIPKSSFNEVFDWHWILPECYSSTGHGEQDSAKAQESGGNGDDGAPIQAIP